LPLILDMSEGAHLSIARQHLSTVAKGLIDDREASVKRAAVIDALAAVDRVYSMLGNRGSFAQEEGTVSATLKASEATSKSGEANIPAAAVKKCGRKGRGSTAPIAAGKRGGRRAAACAATATAGGAAAAATSASATSSSAETAAAPAALAAFKE